MPKKTLSIICSFYIAMMVFLPGCAVVSTTEVSADRAEVKKQLLDAEKELTTYEGGAVASLIKLRIETLKHTDDMLAQKIVGLNRFIKTTYLVDGKTYTKPSNYEDLIESIDGDVKVLEDKIQSIQKESEMYEGGVIQGLLLMQAATDKLTLAMMRQKRYGVLYEFPVYFNPDISADLELEKSRTKMSGTLESNI